MLDYQGGYWYDCCLVDFGKEGSYAAKILGFFKVAERESNCDDGFCAVVHTLKKPVAVEEMRSSFVLPFELGDDVDVDFCVVPVYSIVQPLYVFENEGGKVGEYFCTLPRRRWARFFGDKIDLMK